MIVTLEFKTKGEAEIALAYLKAFAHIYPKIVDIKESEKDDRKAPIITEERW